MSDLVFEDVTIAFGTGRRRVIAADHVDLTVPSGKVVGLVGESGSGKSTLARAAAGLLPIRQGRILLGGRDIASLTSPTHRPIQMIFQDPYSSLDPRRTIGASIGEGIRGIGAERRRLRADRVAEMLDLVGLDPELMHAYPGKLSGGQRQRVALARVLAVQPEVILADEITSALDVSVQGSVLNLVRDVQTRLGLSMLFISHNLSVVRYVSDLVGVMYFGRIVEFGPVDAVLEDPQHPYTRELLASARAAHGATAPDVRNELLEIDPPDPADPPSGCTFHPRCPIGPRVLPDRATCAIDRPGVAGHRNAAACHFAEAVPVEIMTVGAARREV